MTEIYLGVRFQLETEYVNKYLIGNEDEISLRRPISIDVPGVDRAKAHQIVDVFFNELDKLEPSTKEP
jgi:hypothetical protein